MGSILNPAPAREANAWAFLAGKDSVSVFIQNCGKALYILVLVGAIALWAGLIWWAIASPWENWWQALVAAILLILPQAWGEPFLEGAGRWAPVWVIAPCAVYLLLVEPRGPMLFLAAMGSAWAIARVEMAWASDWTEGPRWIRKTAAAVLRSGKEATLLTAAGFGFALVTQIYVVIWSGFAPFALWVWEELVRPLSKLPMLRPKYAAAALFVMMLLTLLDPRRGWVRRWLGAIRTYKRLAALFTAMASFTFYTTSSVNALHRQLPKRMPVQRGPAPTPEQAARRAAYIVWRIELATPEGKQRLAEELRKLSAGTDREWAEREAEEALARDLNGIGAGWFESEDREAAAPPPSQPDRPEPVNSAEAVYAECRQAVVSVLSGVLKSETGTIDVGNDILQPLADALIGAVAPAILDGIVPQDLRDVRSIGRWLAKRRRHPPPMSIEPDWSVIAAEAGVKLPEIRVIPKLALGELSGKPGSEPRRRILP